MFPQQNAYRQYFDLSGFWDFRFDPADQGQAAGWADGFEGAQPVAVPASWNDQFLEGNPRDNLGPAWYQTIFSLPWGFAGQQLSLRFGSVNYLADVWLNGTYLGRHEGGHMAFVFEATQHLRPEENRLVVRVDGRLAPDRVPPGNLPREAGEGFAMHNYPDTAFDFFPYCGVQRPVLLVATPRQAISDVTVTPAIQGEDGLLRVKLKASGTPEGVVRLVLEGFGSQLRQPVKLEQGQGETELRVPRARLWSPAHPNLYKLTIELLSGGEMQDAYSLMVGIRTIAVEGRLLLLNGEPVFLRGFCRHEDFPVTGRGYLPPVIVRDYDLLKWVGANSFRTSHYPYSEQMLDLADRLGFMVIDETQAVGLFFKEDGLERRLDLCKQYTGELIQRDKNHPCVIAWSLANEPHSNHPAAREYFRQLYDLARSLDTSRPVTVVSMVGEAEEAFEFLDLVCLNRYNGWYSQSGDLDGGIKALSAELDALYARYQKPIILSEFGADALPGHHAQPPEMFSEEYQAEFITRYIQLLESKPYVVGEHVWNLCDFKTSQGVIRMNSFNYKGVFTRDRRPKLAAHCIKELWKKA
jgi:beta-glucuronidase